MSTGFHFITLPGILWIYEAVIFIFIGICLIWKKKTLWNIKIKEQIFYITINSYLKKNSPDTDKLR